MILIVSISTGVQKDRRSPPDQLLRGGREVPCRCPGESGYHPRGGTQNSELYQREYFAGCEHGFAVRGDLTKPEVKAGKEGAFKATVEFFLKHL